MRHDGTGWVASSLLYNNGTNIGIGTTSPSEKLTVAGNIGIQANTNAFIGTLTNYGLGIRTNNQDRIFVTATGNVGIGTTSPQYKLDVLGNIRAYSSWLITTGNTGWYNETYGGGWYMSDGSWIRAYGDKNIYTGGEILAASRITSNEIYGWKVIKSDSGIAVGYSSTPPAGGAVIAGNVGIGTTSPQYKLHVVGSQSAGLVHAVNTSPTNNAAGVYGRCANVDGYGHGGYFEGGYTGVRALVYPTGSLTYFGVYGGAIGGSGTNYGVYGNASGSGTNYGVYSSGNFGASGTKSAIVKTSRGPRELYCVESPEIWFTEVGSGKLINGRAHIELDPLFLETVTIDENNPMKVIITLTDECNGVYVKKGKTGFDVIELNNGKSNASFDYIVYAKRKGYENKRLEYTPAGYLDSYVYPDPNDPEIPAQYREKRMRLEELNKRKD